MDETEEWKQISWLPGYDGYEVSSLGRVRSWRPRNRNAIKCVEPRILTPNNSATGGYSWVTLYGEGPPLKFRVHALVAKAFLGRPADGDGLIILHLDDNPENNSSRNLRWGTHRENSIDKSINTNSKHVLRYMDEFARYCNAVSTSKGFWDAAPGPDIYLSKMALIHSEVSEMLEAYRKNAGPKKLTDEFADIFIRLADLWAVMEEEGLVVSLRESIIDKVAFNKTRPHKHGVLA